ncbi:MAG: serine hydrolase [Verrucomicrobiales bacterium]|nr:serine hydrolase [Verrucomicrobiales bacterium]
MDPRRNWSMTGGRSFRRARMAWAMVELLLGAGLQAVAEAPALPADVDQALRARVEYGYNVGIVVGMVNPDGRIVRGYGFRDADAGDAVDGQTLFEIGSITKIFTATLLSDAVVRGEVELDDPVQRFLPESVHVPSGNTDITLRQLAIHRSGLPSLPDNLCSEGIRQPFSCYDVERLYAFLNGFTLTRDPGAAWEYSNLGVGLLGHVLARRSGRDYEALLRERVLDPLGLHSTGEVPPSEAADRVATGYSGAVQAPPFRMPALEGAGVLRSTVDDLLIFLSHHLGILDSPLGPALRATHNRQGSTGQSGVDMGLGWLRIDLPGGTVLQHDGETPGFTAFLGMHPTRRLGVAVLSNSRFNTFAGLGDVGFHLLDSSYPLRSITRPAAVPATTLCAYTGWYRSAAGDVFELGCERDRLVLYHVRSDFEFTLYPQSTTRFTGLDIELGTGAAALFRTNNLGRVTRMDWTQSGQTVAYERAGDAARLELTHQNGQRVVSLRGGQARFDVEASSDLRRWEAIGSLTSNSEPLVDSGASSSESRFFRARRQR